MTPFGNLVVR